MSSRSSSTRLRMDRQPAIAKFTDPSLPAGKRREIDNVMKKARAGTNDYWDKKLLEVEEKDPNRWRHTGYKKMYIEGDRNSSSGGESEREANYRFKRNAPSVGSGNGSRDDSHMHGRVPPANFSRSRSRSDMRKSPISPSMRRRSPPDHVRRGSPPPNARRMPPRSPIYDGRRMVHRTSPPEMSRKPMNSRHSPHQVRGAIRGHPSGGRSSRSPVMMSGRGRRSPPSPGNIRRRSPPLLPAAGSPSRKHGHILPRSRRPPSPPPRRGGRSPSDSSDSSCTDDSCSVCSPSHHRRPGSRSVSRSRRGPHSPPFQKHGSRATHRHMKPTQVRATSPSLARGEKIIERIGERSRERVDRGPIESTSRTTRSSPPLEDPRLRTRPPEPPEPEVLLKKKKPKGGEKSKKTKKLRKIKIEGEKRVKKPAGASSSEDSDDSGDSDTAEEGVMPAFAATTRLTLSERFGKMAQWSMDRSNMENMRITKDSAGGALKVMIEEGLNNADKPAPIRRYSYSPAPTGHFPEELAATAPTGILSWDDVRVRYEYYKSRGYLRDLNLEDYIKWEEWWYKYQEWLKQERYHEYWERQQMRRHRKKLPISQRLN